MGTFKTLLVHAGFPVQLDTQAEIDAIWSTRKDKATRRLLTRAQAEKSLAEMQSRGYGVFALMMILTDHCTRITAEQPVGDPEDVHHIIEPRNRIGFAIEESGDGYALETVETLHRRINLLRRNGKIVGMIETAVLRMESHGGCHVV